jgi:flagellar biosynthesis protein FliR
VADTWLSYLPLAGLAFARCAGALSLAPPTGWRHFPLLLRCGAAAVLAGPLAMALAPGAAPDVVAPLAYLGLVLRNLVTGLLLGMGLWLLVTAMQAAGHLADLWVAGPAEDEEGPLAGFFQVVVIVFFVQLRGPQWLLTFLRRSCDLVPLTAHGVVPAEGPWLYWPGVMLATALRTAAPLVLAVLLASAMVATLDRSLSGLQIGQAAPAVRQAVLILALVVMAPLLGALILGEMDHWAQLLAGALAALGS